MKQASFLIIVIILFLSSSCQQNNASAGTTEPSNVTTEKATNVDQLANRIEVVDFYGTHRCTTCRAIEANSRYTLETYFAQAMKDGQITFQVVNADEDQNLEIAEKFEAAGTSLFLNVIKNGNETIIELTDFAFAKGNDQDAFSKELKARIDEQMKTL